MKIIVHFCVTLVAEVFLEFFFRQLAAYSLSGGGNFQLKNPWDQGTFVHF